jgi:hypothetical protein
MKLQQLLFFFFPPIEDRDPSRLDDVRGRIFLDISGFSTCWTSSNVMQKRVLVEETIIRGQLLAGRSMRRGAC